MGLRTTMNYDNCYKVLTLTSKTIASSSTSEFALSCSRKKQATFQYCVAYPTHEPRALAQNSLHFEAAWHITFNTLLVGDQLLCTIWALREGMQTLWLDTAAVHRFELVLELINGGEVMSACVFLLATAAYFSCCWQYVTSHTHALLRPAVSLRMDVIRVYWSTHEVRERSENLALPVALPGVQLPLEGDEFFFEAQSPLAITLTCVEFS